MDLVVILTEHSGFDYPMIAKFSTLIFDTRNALSDLAQSNVYKL
jgi:UDP-N-acetyl-D-mannosaminuronate dehydrogenase